MIIGITGKIGSGKSIICEEFVKLGFIEDNFASSLKQIGEIIGFENHQLYGTQEQKLEINNKWNISGREFMQKFGTEICRNILPQVITNMKLDNNTLWVQIIKNKIENEYRGKNIIIGDCRFEDEAKMIIDKGGIIIKIIRNNYIANELEQNHTSEKNIDKIKSNITILNNGSLIDYKNKIKYVIENIDKINIYEFKI